VLYILDEPSIGLHQRDNARLIETLIKLRDLGNTVLVVEHDEDTIRAADYVLDMGPRAGELGGRVVAAGTPEQIEKNPQSLTGAYLAGEKAIQIPKHRQANQRSLLLRGARTHNLRDLTVSFPLGVLTCVTGVSGSGKSSLIVDTLLPVLKNRLHGARKPDADFDAIEGLAHVDKSSTSIRPPSAAHRARTQPPSPASSPTFAISSPTCPNRKRADTRPGAIPSTSRAGAARPARVTASCASKCTSCPMSMSNARPAPAAATAAKPWK
jgi:excinuclease UvrABC ATPase subunit